MNDAPEFYAPDRASWRAWLEKHHATEVNVWLIHDKGKNRRLSWSDIVDEALCYGWIDGRANTVSDTQAKIYVSRRKSNSTWSRVNKAKTEVLIADDQMQPAGLAAIELAKANGSWDKLNLSDNLVLPDELIGQFRTNKVAKANFEAFPPSTKRNILAWIYDAKTDATRIKRIGQTVEFATKNLRAR